MAHAEKPSSTTAAAKSMRLGGDHDLVIDTALGVELDHAIRQISPTQLRSADGAHAGLDPAFSRNPYPAAAKVREQYGDVVPYIDGTYGGIHAYNSFGHDLSRPNFAVLGYEALRQIVLDPEHFINRGAYGQHGQAQIRAFPNQMDGDEHRTIRRIFDGIVFARQRLHDFALGSLVPLATHLTRRIRELARGGEPIDLCRDFALPLVYGSMARILGLRLQDIGHFVALGERAFSGQHDMEDAVAAANEIEQHFAREYRRRDACGDLQSGDLMSALKAVDYNGYSFSDEEIIAYCRYLLSVGIETTWRQMANLCFALMAHPAQYREVVADPALRPAAIEEIFRWFPSGQILPRICGKAKEIAGVEIPAGASICGFFAAANRDSRVWENPDAFDIHRLPKANLTFSTGPHFCMGRNLVRQTAMVAMDALTGDLPDMELTCSAGDVELSGQLVRCPSGVPVRLTKLS